MAFAVTPVGRVRCSRTAPEDDNWDAETSVIELDASAFTGEALAGLDSFSHCEVIFLFDQVGDDEIRTGARHPRGNTDWPKIGIFAQRGKGRPNRLGATICRVLKVDGLTLYVAGLDAIDGTPVLDIKPWMQGFAPRGEVHEPAWAAEIMADYW